MLRPVRGVLNYFKTGPDRPLFSHDPAEIGRVYEAKRWSVFISLTIGYGMFYTCRTNFSMVKGAMIADGTLTAGQIGLVGTALLAVYSVGRMLNGFLADRACIRRFMAASLMLSAALNLALGCVFYLKPCLSAGSTETGWLPSQLIFLIFFVSWGLNGWFQSAGSAPSAALLAHWFNRAERSTRYGIWSSSQPIGQFLTYAVTGWLVASGGWMWGFWGPGLLSLLAASIMFFTLADRPQTYGLPNVAQYTGEPPEPASREKASVGQLQLEVLKSPGIWTLAIATGCFYVARYGIEGWAPFFLQTAKGYSTQASGTITSGYSVGMVLGVVGSGFISEFLFRGNRYLPTLGLSAALIGLLVGLYAVPVGRPAIGMALLAGIGFCLGALMVCQSGLMVFDLVSRRAVGAAMGLVGLLSYGSAAIQDTVTGFLLERSKTIAGGAQTYFFHEVFTFWIAAMCLSTMLVATLGLVALRKRASTVRRDFLSTADDAEAAEPTISNASRQ